MVFNDGNIEYRLSRANGFEQFEFTREDPEVEGSKQESIVYCKSYDDFIALLDFWTANSNHYTFSPA